MANNRTTGNSLVNSPSENEIPLSLLSLPALVLAKICDYLSLSEQANLASTNKFLYYFSPNSNQTFFFSPMLTSTYLSALPLFLAVVQGNQSQADSILIRHPDLLTATMTVNDFSGREITGTPFMMALGAGDKWMWEMLLPYFEKIPNGWQEALSQFNRQFPADTSFRIPYTYDFTELLALISQNKTQADLLNNTAAFMLDFRNCYAPKAVRSGKHFDLSIIINVLQIYRENANKWNLAQRGFFWCKVVGYIERLFPAWLVQAFCQGLSWFNRSGFLLQRKLEFNEPGESVYGEPTDGPVFQFYPLDQHPSKQIGYNCALYSSYRPNLTEGIDPDVLDAMQSSLCQLQTRLIAGSLIQLKNILAEKCRLQNPSNETQRKNRG